MGDLETAFFLKIEHLQNNENSFFYKPPLRDCFWDSHDSHFILNIWQIWTLSFLEKKTKFFWKSLYDNSRFMNMQRTFYTNQMQYENWKFAPRFFEIIIGTDLLETDFARTPYKKRFQKEIPKHKCFHEGFLQ